MKDAPHIGQLLASFVSQHKIYQSAWARDAGIAQQTVAKYLKQPHMRVDTLFTICQHLEYNFLRDVANMLPAALPPQAPENQAGELARLSAENQQLKVQVATLEKAISLLGSNK